jgi:hypothetical protein
MKTIYRVTIKNTVYSKKFGTVTKKYTLFKGSYAECLIYVENNWNVTLKNDETSIPAMLYPSILKIE